jgi:hypothetical protein
MRYSSSCSTSRIGVHSSASTLQRKHAPAQAHSNASLLGRSSKQGLAGYGRLQAPEQPGSAAGRRPVQPPLGAGRATGRNEDVTAGLVPSRRARPGRPRRTLAVPHPRVHRPPKAPAGTGSGSRVHPSPARRRPRRLRRPATVRLELSPQRSTMMGKYDDSQPLLAPRACSNVRCPLSKATAPLW